MTGEAVQVYSAHYDLSLTGTIEVQVVNLGTMLQMLQSICIFVIQEHQVVDRLIQKI